MLNWFSLDSCKNVRRIERITCVQIMSERALEHKRIRILMSTSALSSCHVCSCVMLWTFRCLSHLKRCRLVMQDFRYICRPYTWTHTSLYEHGSFILNTARLLLQFSLNFCGRWFTVLWRKADDVEMCLYCDVSCDTIAVTNTGHLIVKVNNILQSTSYSHLKFGLNRYRCLLREV